MLRLTSSTTFAQNLLLPQLPEFRARSPEILLDCLFTDMNVDLVAERIDLAIRLAQPGDVVGLFGKSHEKSMCFGKIEYPWSEHQAVIKALKLKKEGTRAG